MIPATLKMSAPPLWKGPVCVYPWDDLLARRFTVPSAFEEDEPMRLWVALEESGESYIGLPWHCCPEPLKGGDHRVKGEPTFLTSRVVPRHEEQARVMGEVKDFLATGRSGVLQAPTGEGKTIMALDAIAARGVTTLVVVPKEDLITQWVQRAEFALGLKPSEIGRIQQDIVDVRGKPITVASLQSVSKPGRYPPWVYRHFGLLVGDEVHRWGADVLGVVARLFYARQRLGLSATPARADGKNLLVEAHVGPIRVQMKQTVMSPKVLRFRSNWKCPRNHKTGELIPHKPGRIALVLPSLTNHGPRNQMLCKFVGEAYAKGRQIVVFSERIEHLETLEGMLPKYGIPPCEIGRYYGSTTPAQLALAASKRVRLATSKKMGEGTDIPELDTLVFGTPFANVEQLVGRILRIRPGKKQPIVFDVVDGDSPVLLLYAKSRAKVYERLGGAIIDAVFQEAA